MSVFNFFNEQIPSFLFLWFCLKTEGQRRGSEEEIRFYEGGVTILSDSSQESGCRLFVKRQWYSPLLQITRCHGIKCNFMMIEQNAGPESAPGVRLFLTNLAARNLGRIFGWCFLYHTVDVVPNSAGIFFSARNFWCLGRIFLPGFRENDPC